MRAVIDAGPLIALGKLGLIHLLRDLFDHVLVPPAVYDEVVVRGSEVGATEALDVRRAVLRREIGVLSKSEVHLSDIVSALPLGQGEIEAI